MYPYYVMFIMNSCLLFMPSRSTRPHCYELLQQLYLTRSAEERDKPSRGLPLENDLTQQEKVERIAELITIVNKTFGEYINSKETQANAEFNHALIHDDQLCLVTNQTITGIEEGAEYLSTLPFIVAQQLKKHRHNRNKPDVIPMASTRSLNALSFLDNCFCRALTAAILISPKMRMAQLTAVPLALAKGVKSKVSQAFGGHEQTESDNHNLRTLFIENPTVYYPGALYPLGSLNESQKINTQMWNQWDNLLESDFEKYLRVVSDHPEEKFLAPFVQKVVKAVEHARHVQ